MLAQMTRGVEGHRYNSHTKFYFFQTFFFLGCQLQKVRFKYHITYLPKLIFWNKVRAENDWWQREGKIDAKIQGLESCFEAHIINRLTVAYSEF